MPALSCPKNSQSLYRPRRPEKTVLFEIVKKHYKTWHKNAQNPVLQYIDKEFTNYLGCGILARGCACAHCEDCRQEFLVAFSCKGRVRHRLFVRVQQMIGDCMHCLTKIAQNLQRNWRFCSKFYSIFFFSPKKLEIVLE